MRVACALGLLAAVPGLCLAQVEQVQPGDRIRPTLELILRESPPGGLFGLRGREIGKAQTTDQLRVLDSRQISTITGGENWLKVQKLDDPNVMGWVFTGTLGNPTSNIQFLDGGQNSPTVPRRPQR